LVATVYLVEFESDKNAGVQLSNQMKNIKYLEYTVLIYIVMHVFLDSIPSTPSILEGIHHKHLDVPTNIVRKVKDIEVMIVELHESGRAAFKRMQISNHALAPLYLIVFGVLRTLMETSEGFSSFAFWVMVAPLFALFSIVFLRQIFIVIFVNVKKRKVLKHMIRDLAVMEESQPINYLVQQIDIALLIDDAPWSTVLLFTSTALSKLNVESKAILVDALQKRGLRYSQNAANAIEGLFLSCKGKEVTDLKNMTDMGGDYQNLFKLIYSDITNKNTRFNILTHFQTEAFLMKEDNNGKEIGLKILSDIDDTLYSSGGKFPAGCDKEYPKHQLYPGVLKFFGGERATNPRPHKKNKKPSRASADGTKINTIGSICSKANDIATFHSLRSCF